VNTDVLRAGNNPVLPGREESAMNEEVPVLPLLIGACLLLYLGYEVDRRRHKLREVFNVFDKTESKIAQGLETLVESGQLKPYVPARSS
jgi:hypothetical protein